MITRKGITQHFSADGFVQGDERWQMARFANGAAQLDAEVTRIAPFPEPRQESFSLLAPGAVEPLRALFLVPGQREARVSVEDNRAQFCWQHGRQTQRAEQAWGDEAALDYASTLFKTALVLHSTLAPGQTRAYALARLDALTFEPHFEPGVLARLADEEHETRFGSRALRHYTLFNAPHTHHFWCDADGVVFDFVAGDGTRQVLTAVNFP